MQYIPTRIREVSGLWEQTEVILKDPKGRLWTVGLQRKETGHKTPQRSLRKGWVNFSRANELKEGDRCTFELVSQGEGKDNLLQVKINRKKT